MSSRRLCPGPEQKNQLWLKAKQLAYLRSTKMPRKITDFIPMLSKSKRNNAIRKVCNAASRNKKKVLHCGVGAVKL